MKFCYQYRTSDNVRHEGVINAPSRDEAYAILKSRGIRPGSVVEAPGFFNKLFGRGKRWLLIVALAAFALVLFLLWLRGRSELNRVATSIDESQLYEDRAQLYGDPVVIGECVSSGWTNVFSSAFDLYLCQYAIPGRPVAHARMPAEFSLEPIDVLPGDFVEVAQMKRMVNGIKREMQEYLRDGGTAKGFAKRLAARQRSEIMYYRRVKEELSRNSDPKVWRDKNADLRVLGLPMVGLEGAD